ncbi:MAG: hypothetical protein M3032_03845 [Verrucomicrobiota bacterium]|nr:hypothetical protein [Verrucomicrobiota bacterium]
MADQNEKKDVNVQDLAPKKDAKGGVARNPNSANPNSMSQDSANANSFSADSRSLEGNTNLDGGTKNLD